MIILFYSVEMSQNEITLSSLRASYMWTDGGDPQEQSYIKDKVTIVRR